MPLAMSRPWKHPKTGIYQLRKVVPDDLRKLVGKREEKLSLHTRDPAEAKQRFAQALADLEERWANLRSGPKSLTESEAHRLATVVHDRWFKQHRDNPGRQNAWDTELGNLIFPPPSRLKPSDLEYLYDQSAAGDPSYSNRLRMEEQCLLWADEYLAV